MHNLQLPLSLPDRRGRYLKYTKIILIIVSVYSKLGQVIFKKHIVFHTAHRVTKHMYLRS